MRKNFCLNNNNQDQQQQHEQQQTSPLSLSSLSSKNDSILNFNESEGDEAESLMNIYIASNLNDNTFNLLPNEANFFSEQFEYQYNGLINNDTDNYDLSHKIDVIEQFQLFINKIEQIKLQFEELQKYENKTDDLNKTCLTKSFRTMLDTFFGYLYDKNKEEIKQKYIFFIILFCCSIYLCFIIFSLENLMNQTKKQTINNKQLNERFKSALNKIKYLQNQLQAYNNNNNKSTSLNINNNNHKLNNYIGQSQTMMVITSASDNDNETNSIIKKKRFLFFFIFLVSIIFKRVTRFKSNSIKSKVLYSWYNLFSSFSYLTV